MELELVLSGVGVQGVQLIGKVQTQDAVSEVLAAAGNWIYASRPSSPTLGPKAIALLAT